MSSKHPEDMTAVMRLSRDVAKASVTLSDDEARFLVDAYYMMQEDRKRFDNQVLALGDAGEPHAVLLWLAKQSETLEGQIKRALDRYSAANPVGHWARSQIGIGPVITAGLLAHFDIKMAPTAGHFWNFAGLNPGVKWLGAEKARALVATLPQEFAMEDVYALCDGINRRGERIVEIATEHGAKSLTRDGLAKALARLPWNARLKTLCWKIGESFVKVSGNEHAYYGQLYAQRKADETRRNDAGDYAEQAKLVLDTKRIGKSTEAFKHYSVGKLPPAHIHARAKRWTVKIFLSHLHQVWFEHEYGTKPPAPYAIAHLGHAHLMEPPPADPVTEGRASSAA